MAKNKNDEKRVYAKDVAVGDIIRFKSTEQARTVEFVQEKDQGIMLIRVAGEPFRTVPRRSLVLMFG